mmetsp:Transcript_11020/g.22281  ORF Transcript_11020/g.22281 Transcript_11020/m.22281 type:complete len:255 (+) Transcript_11020:104-868(+)
MHRWITPCASSQILRLSSASRFHRFFTSSDESSRILRISSASRFRRFTSSDESSAYIERWQVSTTKPQAFYDEHAAGAPPTYFYHVDLQGRLFLEDVNPKNIATSLKSTKFLNFFFRRLKRLRQTASPPEFGDYSFLSPCQGERNYIRPADQPVVFHTLEGGELVWGGTLTQDFEPSKLAYSNRTGRLYHALTGEVGMQRTGEEWGLVKSSVAGVIARGMEVDEDGNMWVEGSRVKTLPLDREARNGLPTQPTT